jgi:hypothetical protein
MLNFTERTGCGAVMLVWSFLSFRHLGRIRIIRILPLCQVLRGSSDAIRLNIMNTDASETSRRHTVGRRAVHHGMVLLDYRYGSSCVQGTCLCLCLGSVLLLLVHFWSYATLATMVISYSLLLFSGLCVLCFRSSSLSRLPVPVRSVGPRGLPHHRAIPVHVVRTVHAQASE